MAFRTTGPLYVEGRILEECSSFGLLLSNLTGADQTVTVELYAAPFTALNTPETWTRIVFDSVNVPNNTVANLVYSIPQDLPYYQFFINSDGNIRPALYLLEDLDNAAQDFPLIPNADWEIIPA